MTDSFIAYVGHNPVWENMQGCVTFWDYLVEKHAIVIFKRPTFRLGKIT